MRLSKRAIDAATYGGGTDYRWFDSPPGFGLRLYPTGRKSFVLSYRAQGRKRIMVLGRYGVLTPTEARDRARRALVAVTDGDDPSQQRRELRDSPTMRALAERYTTDHAQVKKAKNSSQRNDRSMWRNHVLPRLGSRKVTSIEPDDVDRLHSSLRETPYAANRVVALLSKAFNLAELWGWRPRGTNPCSHVQKFPEEARERYLTSDELLRLGQVLSEVEMEQSELPGVVTAVRLLLLTGCRKKEILKLRWEHVDAERGGLWLPETKTGRRLAPVCRAVFAVLECTPRVAGNPWVIPGRREESHLVNLNRPWERIRQRAGIPDVRLHDLRHTFASIGMTVGLSLPIVGRILGHTQPATTARYAHIAESPVRQGVELIGAQVASVLQPEGATPSP